MSGQYPALDQIQVESILKQLKFSVKNKEGSHTKWEGYVKGQRRIVTVDDLKSRKEKYGKELLRLMISQSRLTKKEFYGFLR